MTVKVGKWTPNMVNENPVNDNSDSCMETVVQGAVAGLGGYIGPGSRLRCTQGGDVPVCHGVLDQASLYPARPHCTLLGLTVPC